MNETVKVKDDPPPWDAIKALLDQKTAALRDCIALAISEKGSRFVIETATRLIENPQSLRDASDELVRLAEFITAAKFLEVVTQAEEEGEARQ